MVECGACLLYTSDAADEEDSVEEEPIKKKKITDKSDSGEEEPRKKKN